ncbi:MAG: hypothetical protein ACJ8LG_24035 [Massilia sp.]
MPYTPAPAPTNFAFSAQAKLQAAAHWSVITKHMEQALGPSLANSPRRPLFVRPLQATPFNQAVASQLMTLLVNDGHVVSKTPEAALNVDIDTQVVQFSARRPHHVFNGAPSALAAGAWALSQIQPTSGGLAIAAIGAFDAYSWFHSEIAPGATPQTEIIVTVSVSDERRYYARYTSVYYTTDSDQMLYGSANAQLTKSFAVKGS